MMSPLSTLSGHIGLLFSLDHAAGVMGASASTVFHDARAMASAVLYAQALYGHDLVIVHSDAFIMAEAAGARCRFSDTGPPVLANRPTSAPTRPVDPGRDGRLPLLLEAASAVRCRLLGVATVAVSLTGPLTVAASVAGEAGFLRSLTAMDSRVVDLLDWAEESTGRVAGTARREGLMVMIAEPLAAMLSPSLFCRAAAPALRRLLARRDMILHICGDSAPLLHLLRTLGACAVSLDDVDLVEASRVLSDGPPIMGGMSPAEIRKGPPRRVRAVARECFASAPAIIPCSGCDLVWDTPPEHVCAFVQGVRDALVQRESRNDTLLPCSADDAPPSSLETGRRSVT